jgi:hypothetical protein
MKRRGNNDPAPCPPPLSDEEKYEKEEVESRDKK